MKKYMVILTEFGETKIGYEKKMLKDTNLSIV